jgi:hypothetical protein
MPKVRINGSLRPIRQPIQVSFDPQHGQQISIPFESAGNNLIGLAQAFQQLRIPYELKPNGKRSTLIAKPTGGQLGIPNVSADEWQLLPNEIQLSINYSPGAMSLSDAQLKEIADAIADPAKDFAFTGVQNEVYTRLVSGEASFVTGQPVLHHSTNVWDGFLGNVANINQNRIYTTGQLLAECGPTRGWVYPIPQGIIGAIESIEALPFRDGWQVGWRKLPAHLATAAGNRIAITSQYYYGQFDMFYYAQAVL